MKVGYKYIHVAISITPRLKHLSLLTLYYTIPTFNTSRKKKAFENIVGKGDNAGYQHCLLFLQYFPPFPKQILIFWSHLFCRLQTL